MEKEGWTPEHDDEHSNGTLALAAACYALEAQDQNYFSFGNSDLRVKMDLGEMITNSLWPWDECWWKPGSGHNYETNRRNLVKAGALIAAELERLDRANSKEK